MMIVYTAEDFAQADLAVRGESGVARRAEPRLTHQWRAYGEGHGWFSDEEMAADGWEPVVESRIPEGTLRRVEEREERKRQKLIAHIASVEAAVRDRNRTIEELQVARENDALRESAAHDRVVTLLGTKETLERTIYELRHDLAVARKGREPWADLADALVAAGVAFGDEYPDLLARRLYERGVRLKGGDDDE